jgi:thioredoxin 1
MKRDVDSIGLTRLAAVALAAALLFFGISGCKDSSHRTGSKSHSTNIVILTEANFQAEVLSASKPVLVDFWATWCGPCKVLAPVIEEIATDYSGRIIVGKLDVDTAPALAQRYGIQAIPTVILFKGGRAVDQSLGVVSKRDLQAKLDKVLADTAAEPKR